MHCLPTYLSRFLTSVAIVGMLIAMAGIQPALASDAEQPAASEDAQEPQATEEEGGIQAEVSEDEGVIEEIVVKGFRHSLEQSVDLKRAAVNVRESIVAEDIGKMPDLNLAEAIQRVPGVAIVREGGEGRQMSLRGLGPGYTRVTLNGMEVPSSGGGLDSSGGVNRGRTFDFNIFSAELFNRIDVNKSAVASIEEGGLAGSVEMYTARPLDNPGLRGSVSVQAGYNDLSEDSDPRVSATFSMSNKAETVGFLISTAYEDRTPYQDGFGTVRWSYPAFQGREFAGNETGIPDDQLNNGSIYFPRLPRQDSFRHNQSRIGLSTALQFRPNDDLDICLKWVHSDFDAENDANNSFAQFRRSGDNGWQAITVLDLTTATMGTGTYAIAGLFDGVRLRTESRQTVDNTVFDQLVADFTYDFSDDLRLSGMIGNAVSDYNQDYYRANLESNDYYRFSYDFTANPDIAAIHYYNVDLTDPANFTYLPSRHERNNVKRTNNTLRLDLDWDANRDNALTFGMIYNDREVDAVQAREDPGIPDNLAAITYAFHYVDLGGYGSSTDLDFLAIDYEAAKQVLGYGSNFVTRLGPSWATWTVGEKTTGVYVDYNLTKDRFRLNAGVRYVMSDVEGLGYTADTLAVGAGLPVRESGDYSNILPSINFAFDATDDIVLRASVGQTMSRPGLGNLAPAKSITDVTYSIASGNPGLEPEVADNVDLGLEWYFSENSLLGFAYFYKSIADRITRLQVQEPLRAEDYALVEALYPDNPQLLDPSNIWTYTLPVNAQDATVKGWEIAYLQEFSSLPGFWSNFGIVANYSHVNAEEDVIQPTGEVVTVPFNGLSENTWNATLYYEMDVFGIRFSMNSRDDYRIRDGRDGNVSESRTGPVRLDMSSFYHINDSFTLSLEIINLTDEAERNYVTGDDTMDLVYEYNKSGIQAFLGARYNF